MTPDGKDHFEVISFVDAAPEGDNTAPQTSVRIPRAVYRQLEAMAAGEKTTVQDLVMKGLTRLIDERGRRGAANS